MVFNMDYRRLKPRHGLLLFFVVIAALIFVATPLQYSFGINGVALTELMLLALTASAYFIVRPRFETAFPLRLPPIREFFGGAFLYTGVYLLMIPPLLLIQYFFPQINETADSLTKLGTSVSPAMAVLIIAVMPAICEEVLHRGFILSSFKPLKNTAAIVLLNGLIFGIFHLDFYRFLPTMMLGCAFAYIALKTGSMVLTILFHFINNLFSVISMFTTQSSAETVSEYYSSLKLATVIGVGLIYIAIGAVLLFIGVCMLNRRTPKPTTIAIVVISAIVCAAAGTITAASTSITTIMDMSGTFTVSAETDGSITFPLELDRDGIYSFSVSALCQNTDITFTLERAENKLEPGETAEAGAQTNITINSEKGFKTKQIAVNDIETNSETNTEGDIYIPDKALTGGEVLLSQIASGALIMSQNLELEEGDYIIRITLTPEREGVYPDVTAQIMVLRLVG